MSPQRKPVKGNIPQRRLVHLETRSARQVPAQPQTQPAASAIPVNNVPASKSTITPQAQKSNSLQSFHNRPKPFHQKLPSAAELAALSGNKIRTSAHQPKAVQPPIAKTNNSPNHITPVQKSSSQFSHRSAPVARPTPQQAQPPKPLFEQVITQEKNKKKSKGSRKIQFVFMGAGILIFIIGIVVSIMGMRTNQQVAAQAKQVSSAASQGDQSGSGDDPAPSETPLGRNIIAAYKVQPDEPRKLIIPKIGVDTRVTQVGLKDTNELKTPSNIYDTAWYTGSAKPGQPGATLIDGHVHGLTQPGIFYNLKRLSKDDTIIVEKGDGTQIKYKVVKTQTYDASNTDMKAAVSPVVEGQSGLNLITCTGKINKNTNTYNERLLVFATIDK